MMSENHIIHGHEYHLLTSPLEEEVCSESCNPLNAGLGMPRSKTSGTSSSSFDLEMDHDGTRSRVRSDSPCSSSSSSSSSSSRTCRSSSRYFRSPNHEVLQRYWYSGVLLYGITTMLLFADQNLLAPNLSTIAKEFHFNDMERDYYLGGHIALGFFVVGAPASYVIGMIADCTSSSSSVAISRSTLFALTIILGEGSCLSTYFVRNYTQLYVTRILTGISVGGAIPIIYSLLGDIFPPHDRPFVTAIVGMGTGCGIALGQGIAGWIGPIYGWRTPFLIISIPAILCAILIALFVPEPQRGCMDSTPPLFNTSTTTTTTSHAELITTTTTNATTTDTTTDTTTIAQYDENTNNHLLKEKEEEHTHLVNILQHMDDPVNDDDAQQQLIQCTKISTAQHTSNNDTQNDHSRFMEEINTMAIHTSHTTYSNHTNNIIVTCYTSTISPTLSLLRIPTVLLILLQGAPGCIPWGIVNTYLNDYLSTEQHLSIQMATTMLLLFGFGNFVGMSLGGYGGTLLYTKNVRYPHLLSGFSAILSILPLFVLINFTPIANNPSSTPSSSLSPTSSMSSTFYTTTSLLQCNTIIYGIAAIFAGIGSGVTGPIVKATLTNVTIPTSRGTAFALLNTFDDFGRGLGPLFVAILIQSLHGNRQQAFNIGILGWALCGIFNLAIYFFAPTDEQTMRDTLSKYYNDDTIT